MTSGADVTRIIRPYCSVTDPTLLQCPSGTIFRDPPTNVRCKMVDYRPKSRRRRIKGVNQVKIILLCMLVFLFGLRNRSLSKQTVNQLTTTNSLLL